MGKKGNVMKLKNILLTVVFAGSYLNAVDMVIWNQSGVDTSVQLLDDARRALGSVHIESDGVDTVQLPAGRYTVNVFPTGEIAYSILHDLSSDNPSMFITPRVLEGDNETDE